MKLLIISIFVLTLSFYSNAQNLKILKPIIGNKISYSQKEQEEWIKTIDLYDKMNKSPISYDSLSDRDKILIDKIEMGDGPVTIYGDNWYNGGGPYKITSSSNLISTNTGNYKVDNIQDFNLLTAWGTRNSNNAIGEYVEFYFIPFSPRVNKIIYIMDTSRIKVFGKVTQE
jgi:hypothetical protein